MRRTILVQTNVPMHAVGIAAVSVVLIALVHDWIADDLTGRKPGFENAKGRLSATTGCWWALEDLNL